MIQRFKTLNHLFFNLHPLGKRALHDKERHFLHNWSRHSKSRTEIMWKMSQFCNDDVFCAALKILGIFIRNL